MPHYTPTEQRILTLLSDGKAHRHEELRALLDDEQAGKTAVPYHIFNLRAKLKPIGEDILRESNGRASEGYYRHVRILSSPYRS